MPKTLDILVLTVFFQLSHRQQWPCPTNLSLTPQRPTCTTIETPPKKEGGGPWWKKPFQWAKKEMMLRIWDLIPSWCSPKGVSLNQCSYKVLQMLCWGSVYNWKTKIIPQVTISIELGHMFVICFRYCWINTESKLIS